ncbi:MAG: hypothetical protein RLZZ522_1809 [Verrucomicrobiota bacterium]|jgi:hypothetical protein
MLLVQMGGNHGIDGGASITGGTPAAPKQRYKTHLVLAESRIWQNLDGRTLEGKKPFELPLTNLVKADQEFIETIRLALAKKAAVKP